MNVNKKIGVSGDGRFPFTMWTVEYPRYISLSSKFWKKGAKFDTGGGTDIPTNKLFFLHTCLEKQTLHTKKSESKWTYNVK